MRDGYHPSYARKRRTRVVEGWWGAPIKLYFEKMAAPSYTQRVLAHLEARGASTVAEMASALGADVTTVRRALKRLARVGLVERRWGGAQLFQAVRYVGEMARQHEEAPEAKRTIALKAAALVEPGMRIALSGGTTCTYFARLLRNKSLTIYTNAVNIAVELFSYPKTHVFLLPGKLNLYSYEVVGAETLEFVSGLPPLDAFFVGTSAVGPKGFYLRDEPEARVARALAKRAKRVYVLAHRDKWGREPAPHAFFASHDQVTAWITED